MLKLLNIALFSFAFLISGNANASIVSLEGNNVIFKFDSSKTGLFGSDFYVAGDTLFFLPTDFRALSLNGAGADFKNQTLNIKVTSKNDSFKIPGFKLIENGDYLSTGLDDWWWGSSTDVNATGRLTATDLNSGSVVRAGIVADNPFTSTGLDSVEWNAETFVDTSSFMSNSFRVRIQNILLATSYELGDIAFIEKNFVGLTAVPLPASIWLLGAALIGLISSTKRRQTV